jgi:Right handed beta helix region
MRKTGEAVRPVRIHRTGSQKKQDFRRRGVGSRRREQYTNNARTVYLGNNTFEIPYWNLYLKVGDVMMVRHWGWDPWKNAIQTGASYNLDFENVNIYASPYLGFYLAGGGGYRLSHCSVTRLNGPGLFISRANDVVVNNQFKNTNLLRAPNVKSSTADFYGSIIVTHAHNVYVSKNAIEKAGPISIDTTSTDGIRH